MGFRGGGTRPKDPTLEKDGETREFAGFTPDILTDHALEFIREHREHTFFLALHFRAPHARWLPVADEDWAPYEDLEPRIPNPDYPKLDVERVKRMTREYMASVSSVDRNLGRVLALLDELELRDETAVIFTSDHGYNMGHHGIWHKGNGHWVLTQPPPASKNIPKNQRPNMYEHSIRVPTAVRWPGMIRPGTVMKRTVTNLDWYPTILAMAGLKPPAGTTLRGRNFLPLLKGEKIAWNDDLFAEYSTHHQTHTHMRMFRTSRWKLIRDFLNPGRDELYDLGSDPDERRNLIFDGRAEVRAAILALDEKMLAQMEKIGDPLGRDKRD